ncbi:MAG: hypothetical protein GW761_11800 [Leptospira sp.]|nr:hypothetical protein [Leptospira sp.]
MNSKDKAALIYRLLDKDLPLEVFNYLSDDEAKKILTRYDKVKNPSTKIGNSILHEFNSKLRSSDSKFPIRNSFVEKKDSYLVNSSSLSRSNSISSRKTEDDEFEKIIQEINNIVTEEDTEENSGIEILQIMSLEELGKLIFDEDPSLIAQILTFCPTSLAKEAITFLPKNLRELVFEEMGNLDFHSRDLRDELERFIHFKKNFISTNQSPQKVKWKQGKKAAELLSSLNPGESQEILSKIQKKRPSYAENIIEHYYSFKDLLLLGRTSLSKFLGDFHPLVLATALKGVEKDLKAEILASLDPWLAKSVQLESDSLGAVSLAEIEECHLGILDRLREEIEQGRIKLWKFR